MIVNKVSFIKPKTNCTQRLNFGHNKVNKFAVIRAFDDARFGEQPLVHSYTTGFMKRVSENQFPQRPLIIGITGESASGKTTITNALNDIALKKGLSLSCISCDNYYNDLSSYYKKYGGYAQALFAGEDLESPKSFNLDKIYEDLEELKKGKTIKTPDFNFATGISTPNVHEVKPAKFMILEGVVANNTKANDINIYVDCPEDLKLSRALARAEERGKTLEDMRRMWDIVCESAKRYIIPLKENADLVLSGQADKNALNVFVEKLLKAFKK